LGIGDGEDLTSEAMSQSQQLQTLAGHKENLERIGGKSRSVNSALNVEDQRNQDAQEADHARIEQYTLQSRVRLAEVTVEITVKPAKKVAGNPYSRSAATSLAALRIFGRYLLLLLIPVAIWLPCARGRVVFVATQTPQKRRHAWIDSAWGQQNLRSTRVT
jgi:hypothetical protein